MTESEGSKPDPFEPLLVFGLSLACLIALARGLGLTWDESTYFIFSDSVAQWFRAGADLSADALQRAWAYDPFFNPHPPLFKVLDAIGAGLTTGLLPFPLNYRFAHLVYVAVCLALLYALLRPVATHTEAAMAVAFAALIPRALGDLLLATTDGPVMVGWLLAVVLAGRIAEAPDEGRSVSGLRALLVAVCAIAGATKFTGLLIAIPIGAYFLLRRRWRDVLVTVGASVSALVLMIATSPDKWRGPIAGVVQYLSYPFHRSQIPIPTTYLGQLHSFNLPWHYFIVMSLVTFPIVLWLCLPGLLFCPPRLRSLAQSLGVAVGFWLVVVHLPNTPRHDGVRQFVSVYPLLGLLAWIGVLGFMRTLAAERPDFAARASWVAVVPALCLLLIAARTHPYEMSYYNGFIGGIQGAEKLGMETTYFFDALDDAALKAIETRVQPGQVLGMSPFWPRLFDSYRDHGRLRGDFRIVDHHEPSDWLLLYRRRNLVNDEAYLRTPAVYEVRYDGVSLLKLVQRTRPEPPAR